MGIHVLSHLGHITLRIVIIQVRVTDNGLLLGADFVVLAELLEGVLVGSVPSSLSQQVVSVVSSCNVDQRVHIDPWAIKTSSEVVDGFDDLTTNLSHLVKRRQVCIGGILIEIERLVATRL